MSLIIIFFLILLPPPSSSSSSSPSYPCLPPHSYYPFCNLSLPISTRSLSLLSLLSLPDKILLLSDNSSSLPRVGLPPYLWWSESLHGIATNGPGISFSSGPIPSATSFPQVLLSAASFNRSLFRSLAIAISTEARAMHNRNQAGLTFWAPNINLFRDPRWGRGQETPGEDPLLAAVYAVEYVKGFQDLDESTGKMKLSACCKHYTAYDLDKWGNFTRYMFDAIVSKQDMEDTFQVPFRGCIEEGKASCLMCSYNQVNGVPVCANRGLLQKAREEWGFEG